MSELSDFKDTKSDSKDTKSDSKNTESDFNSSKHRQIIECIC